VFPHSVYGLTAGRLVSLIGNKLDISIENAANEIDAAAMLCAVGPALGTLEY